MQARAEVQACRHAQLHIISWSALSTNTGPETAHTELCFCESNTIKAFKMTRAPARHTAAQQLQQQAQQPNPQAHANPKRPEHATEPHSELCGSPTTHARQP